MAFSLLPREMKFFDMFEEVVAILTRAAGKFLDMIEQFDRLSARGQEILVEEQTADEVVERIIKALDRSFITPFDREDIHTLATRLDDVLDNIEETAHRLEIFRFDKVPDSAKKMAKIIHQCCVHVEHAVHGLRKMAQAKLVQNHLREIGKLENEADKIYREAEAALFAAPPDNYLALIKQRELYTWLEATVDACKNVSWVISEIVIKGS